MTPTISQYIPSEVLAYPAFALVVLLTIGGALIAVLHKEIVHNVFGLATCVCGVAGLFIFLGSEFLAVMEILIYVGAISIAIVYAVMLSMPLHRQKQPRRLSKIVLSFVISAMAFISLALVVARTSWAPAALSSSDWSVKRLGILLYTRYELMFELISVILLVAIIGAIITASVFANAKRDAAAGSRSTEGH